MKLEPSHEPIIVQDPAVAVGDEGVPAQGKAEAQRDGAEVAVADTHTYFVSRTLSVVEQAAKANGGAAVEWTADELGPYPTVDVRPWMGDAASNPSLAKERDEVVDLILEQVTTAGSFNITGHGVPKDLMGRLDAASREFFAMPVEAKDRYYNAESKRGYIQLRQESVASVYGYEVKATEKHDLRECYSVVYPPDHLANAACPENYRQVLNEYLAHMDRLDTALSLLFTAALARVKGGGVSIPSDLLETAKGGARGLFKATFYPSLGDEYRDAVKLAAHSDWGTITILRAPERGLEEIRDGRWVKVPVTSGEELHVVVGDMIAIWTNLAFVNNVHRVNDFEGERASYAYFCGGQRETAGGQRGIAPVCGPDEAPRFGAVSFIDHTDKLLHMYRSL